MILMLLTQLYQLFFDDLDTHPIIMPVLTRSQTKQLSSSTNISSMNVASVTSPIDTTNDICLPCSTTSSQHCDLSCSSLLSSSCTVIESLEIPSHSHFDHGSIPPTAISKFEISKSPNDNFQTTRISNCCTTSLVTTSFVQSDSLESSHIIKMEEDSPNHSLGDSSNNSGIDIVHLFQNYLNNLLPRRLQFKNRFYEMMRRLISITWAFFKKTKCSNKMSRMNFKSFDN